MVSSADPRQDAFGDSDEAFELALTHHLQAPDWTLVHGTIIGPDSGPARRVHAWLEREGRVYDPSVERVLSVEVYTQIVGAVPAMRYSAQTARQWRSRTRHAGPWEDCCLADDAMRNEIVR